MRHFLLAALLAFAVPVTAAEKLLEPALSLSASTDGVTRVAITLDACSGDIDRRILDVIIAEQIPVTLFITERWMLNNSETITLLAAHPALFDIQNHGKDHVPAVIGEEKPYGITPVGTIERLNEEVMGGANAIRQAFGTGPVWFRGATALYTQDALNEISRKGFRVAGFSLNADFGATASADIARTQLVSAKDGDVVIAHINQPNRAAGAGIAAGLIELRQRGVQFVQLGHVAP